MADHLTEGGVMDSRRLDENSFADLDDQGISGVFLAAEVKQLIQLLHDVKERDAA